MTHGDPVAAAHTALCAVLTRGLLAAGCASEDARDHDTLPRHEVADVIALMELGRIVWCGPRADADLHLLAAAYLGGTASTEVPG